MNQKSEPIVLVKAGDAEQKPQLYACAKCGRVNSPLIYACKDEMAHEAARRSAVDCYHCKTDYPCSECGKQCRQHYTVCDKCSEKKKHAQWKAMEVVPWNGEGALYSESHEQFFWCAQEVDDYLHDHEDATLTEDNLQLVICTPTYPRQFEPDDFYHDDLPEEQSAEDCFSKEAWEAMAALNTILAKHAPISWGPYGETRPAPLATRPNTQTGKGEG